MNFFRDVTRRRRSSSASSAGEVSPTLGTKLPCDKKQQFSGGKDPQQNQNSYMSIGGKHVALSSIGATATLRRVFLPRSRTTGFQQSNNLTEDRNHESEIRNHSKTSQNNNLHLYINIYINCCIMLNSESETCFSI